MKSMNLEIKYECCIVTFTNRINQINSMEFKQTKIFLIP